MLDSLVVSSPSLTICKASQERESSFLNTFWHLVNFWTVFRGGGVPKCRLIKGGCVDLELWIWLKCRQGGRGSKIQKIV